MRRPGRPCLTSIREIRKVRHGECVDQRRSATKIPSENMSRTAQTEVESPFAWLRLLVVVVLGTVGPPVLQHFIAMQGWRTTHIGVGLFCVFAMPPLIFALRRHAPVQPIASADPFAGAAGLGLSPNALQTVLCVAGVACCVAM